MNPQKGVCCQYCIMFEKSACPIKEASPWSRWGDWCSQYERIPAEKGATTIEEASSGRAKPETTALPVKYGEPWRTMAPPNGGVLLRMGQDDLTLQSVQIFPKEKGERIKECVNACAGMDEPEKEIRELKEGPNKCYLTICEKIGEVQGVQHDLEAERHPNAAYWHGYEAGLKCALSFLLAELAHVREWLHPSPEVPEPADEGAQQ